MAAVESQMLELGTRAPSFALPDADGAVHSMPDGAAAYLLMFICNHCPFVKHVADELARIGRDYGDKGVAIFAINSNDIDNYPADAPDKMRAEAAMRGYSFPYLLDAEQATGADFLAVGGFCRGGDAQGLVLHLGFQAGVEGGIDQPFYLAEGRGGPGGRCRTSGRLARAAERPLTPGRRQPSRCH